jgi:hypothetical protein
MHLEAHHMVDKRSEPLIDLEAEQDLERHPHPSRWVRIGLIGGAVSLAVGPLAGIALAADDESPKTPASPRTVSPQTVTPMTVSPNTVSPNTVTPNTTTFSPTAGTVATVSPQTVSAPTTSPNTTSPDTVSAQTAGTPGTGLALGRLFNEGNRAALAAALGLQLSDLDQMSLGEVLQLASDAGQSKSRVAELLAS